MPPENVMRRTGSGSGAGRTVGVGGRARLAERAGRAALLGAAEPVDRLHDALGVSLLSRRGWLQAWADSFPCWEPWVLTLVERREVRAVAPLARRRTRLGVEVVAIGDHDLAETPLAARDDSAAEALAAGLFDALRASASPWTLRLGQLPAGSALSAALLARFPGAIVWPGSPRPVLHLADDRPPERWLPRNTAKSLAKARNRVAREGRRMEVRWIDRWEEVRNELRELVAVHRDSDLELRGATLLDDARQARFYGQVLARHAGLWRLLAVRIDGSLAGYALCLVDGRVLRVWDNRVAPAWRRYSAGLIANAEVVQLAARAPSIGVVDWGCGEQRYKLSLSNEVIRPDTLSAWSSPARRVAWAYRSRLAARRARWSAARRAPRRLPAG